MTDEELAKAIGRNVRAARLAAGLSQADLEELTGIAKHHISRLEAGKHLPKVVSLKRVSDAIRVPIARLFDTIPIEEPQAVPVEPPAEPATPPAPPPKKKRPKK